MKRLLVLLAMCATVAVPVAAFGQAGPPGMQAPPTADQRAAMDRARADAKTAAYLVLSPAHKDRVNAIIADVAAGKRAPREAAKLIDDVLTPDEQKGVRDAAQAARRAAPPRGRRFGPPSAGRFLIMLSISREQMRSLMPRARSSSAQ